jgi:hypothetical protein
MGVGNEASIAAAPSLKLRDAQGGIQATAACLGGLYQLAVRTDECALTVVGIQLYQQARQNGRNQVPFT